MRAPEMVLGGSVLSKGTPVLWLKWAASCFLRVASELALERIPELCVAARQRTPEGVAEAPDGLTYGLMSPLARSE